MAHSHFSRSSLFAAACIALGACAVPNGIETLDASSPPPEFGRPAWVRTCAGVGAWVGGIGGGLVSIVLLPITFPISLLAEDGLGEHSSGEFLFFPALGGASVGHCLFGMPPDVLDYFFRRLWVGTDDPIARFDFIPMAGPAVPRQDPQPEPPKPPPGTVPEAR